jgi:tripartite-type tricarboxylate transporter receptor subunit TctC
MALDALMKNCISICFYLIIFMCAVPVPSLAQRTAIVQDYPTKPIRFIVPQATGGSNDTLARLMGHHLSERLGKQVVVDNRPGADGIIGTEMAARASPDGHTWLMVSGAYAMNAAVRKMPYDPATAFAWFALLGNGPSVLVTHPSIPVASVKDIIALGKAKPGYFTMASAGGFQHFVSELFHSLSGIDMAIVLYRGGFPALLDVMSGQAHLLLGSLVTSNTHIRSGKLKAIATGGAKRTALLPDLPTIAESGLPGYDASNYWAIATAAGTPPAIINRVSNDIGAILKLAETQKRFTAEGAETDFKPAGEVDKIIKAEIVKWTRVAKEARMPFEK